MCGKAPPPSTWTIFDTGLGNGVATHGVGGVQMNKVASTTWVSILILIAIVVTALVLYNN